MRSSRTIHVVGRHAEARSATSSSAACAAAGRDDLGAVALHRQATRRLRNFVLNEPRGGVFRHVNLLVPPKDPRAQMGFIIMEPADTPPMSGSNRSASRRCCSIPASCR